MNFLLNYLCGTRLNLNHFSWTKPQVQARSHPNLLAATVWLNKLYTAKPSAGISKFDGVDLDVPLTYADRFRIRKPGLGWNFHPPHIDGR